MVDIQYLKIGWDVFKALKAIRDALTDGQRTKDDLGSWIQLFQAIEAAVAFSPSSRTEESMPPRTVAVSVAVAAFAETWNDWWAGSSDAAPLPSRKRFGKLSQLVFGTTTRERQFAFAIRSALSEIAKSPESDDHPLFVGDPAASASYRALWKALVDEDLELVRIALSLDGELHEKLEPLMPEGAGDKHRFESAFRYSFRLLAQRHRERLAPHAEELGATKQAAQRAAALTTMSDWENQELFPKLFEQPRGLTLGELYVEPAAVEVNSGSSEENNIGRGVLSILNDWLDGPSRVLVILGQLGLGKSLTARTFSSDVSRRALASHLPSSECWFPFYAPSTEVLTDGKFNLDHTLRLAAKLVASQAGLDPSLDDESLTPPSNDQRVVVVLDGLDEKLLSQVELEELFRRLRELSGERRRFVVFSRPNILEPVLRSVKELQVLELQPFESNRREPEVPSRVEQWLNRWNRLARVGSPPITPDAIIGRGIIAEARTPIVLFMIAFTWDALETHKGSFKTALYETFFSRVIARSKLPESGELHSTVDKAAEKLATHLSDYRLVAEDANPAETLLWVLSAIAWESHCREQRPRAQPLDRGDIEEFLKNKLKCKGLEVKTADLILDGTLLALQYGSRDASNRIFYGHKSFREFLVARFWERQLRRAVKELRMAHWDLLRGGCLDVFQDASKRFLRESLQSWDDRDLEILIRQAQEQFEDDRIIGREGEARMRDDVRVELRHSAMVMISLARAGQADRIGLAPEAPAGQLPGLSLKQDYLFRSLALGMLMVRHGGLRIWLQGAHLKGILLLYRAAHYYFAEGSRWTDCFVQGFGIESWFNNAQFDRCHISGYSGFCTFDRAVFNQCDLDGDFTGCSFADTVFDNTFVFGTFSRCVFSTSSSTLVLPGRESDHQSTRFVECQFQGTRKFSGSLHDYVFEDCDLASADFLDADLRNARFVKCNLTGAQFRIEDLSSIVFESCVDAPNAVLIQHATPNTSQ